MPPASAERGPAQTPASWHSRLAPPTLGSRSQSSLQSERLSVRLCSQRHCQRHSRARLRPRW
eukprot:7213298-Alexandrium_andersonii.AAC.1